MYAVVAALLALPSLLVIRSIDKLCISATSFTPLSRHQNLSRLGINASDVRNEVTDSSRVSVLVVVLSVSSIHRESISYLPRRRA
jgi:hypothetical protein